jgi:hypothetical protein
MIYVATSSSSWLSSLLHQHSETLLSVALATAATVVVAVIIARRQRRPKTLDYAILANSPIISDVSRRLGTSLKVSWGTDAHPLPWPRLTVLRFKNTGRRGIRRSEILEPLSITVTGASRVVDATVTAVSATHVHELGQREVEHQGDQRDPLAHALRDEEGRLVTRLWNGERDTSQISALISALWNPTPSIPVIG